jgi:3',5'-cyclic-nucleotide phosphodiesterase
MPRLLPLALAALACRPPAAPAPPDLSSPPGASDLSSAPDPTAHVEPRFTVVVLGAQGGIVSDDLSAYLVSMRGTAEFVCLDGGSVYTGLQRAAARDAFAGLLAPDDPSTPVDILRHSIRAYLISHPHLDHVFGLVLASPDDVAGKTIAGLAPTVAAVRDHLFNHVVWANLGDSGREPHIGRYHLRELAPEQPVPLPNTPMTVEAWPLSHHGGVSTAFLVREPGGGALLYLGDTGPDAVERSDRLARLWRRVAPLVRAGALRAIFIEVSYPDPRPNDQLYGHLTPKWLDTELRALAAAVDANDPAALRGLTVAITHIKPTTGGGPDARRTITSQLARTGAGARLIFPIQGDRLEL